MDSLKLRAELIRDEGIRLKPYEDSVRKLTTIGCGRNLIDVGISRDEAMYLLENDIKRARQDCLLAFSWFESLSDVRQRVIINMAFNLGIGALKGFVKMLTHIAAGRYDAAAAEMLSSLWAEQTGQRALRLAHMMWANSDAPE